METLIFPLTIILEHMRRREQLPGAEFEFYRTAEDMLSWKCEAGDSKTFNLVVMDCLIALQANCPGVKIKATNTNKDWKKSKEWCQAQFGYGDGFVLD